MVKSFRQFVLESPNETDAPVTVSMYLPQAPRPDWTDRAQKLFAAVRDGRLPTVNGEADIAFLVPTQATVSSIKVMRAAHNELGETLPPLVWRHDGQALILDGHHRVCGAAVNGARTIPIRGLVGNPDAIASILEN